MDVRSLLTSPSAELSPAGASSRGGANHDTASSIECRTRKRFRAIIRIPEAAKKYTCNTVSLWGSCRNDRQAHRARHAVAAIVAAHPDVVKTSVLWIRLTTCR